jgi:outer membrane receptor protein involved in Fe transport
VGDTRTLGFILKPDSGPLAGLRASVDYYQIKLKGAITNLATNDLVNGCSAGSAFFCSFFTFASAAPNAAPTSIFSPSINLGSRKTSGFDISVDYEKAFDGFKLATNLSGSNTIESIIDTGIAGANSRINRAGENGQSNAGTVPTWRANLSETLTVDRFSGTAQVLYISGGKLDVTYNTSQTTMVNDNSIPPIAYLNLFGSFDVTKKARVFAAVNNVLDRDPPTSPFITLTAPNNAILYDKIGRAYQLGVDLKF